MKMVFATANQNKAAEIRALLPQHITLVTLADLNVTEEIQETGITLKENAEIKADYVFREFGLPVFADDTGLLVRALNNEPGVYSARYAGEHATYEENCNKLLSQLNDKEDRSAEFTTVICYIDAEGKKSFFSGNVKGAILNGFSGSGGFGYDPIFIPDGYTLSFAEMSMLEKNTISHRALAFNQLVNFLKQTAN